MSMDKYVKAISTQVKNTGLYRNTNAPDYVPEAVAPVPATMSPETKIKRIIKSADGPTLQSPATGPKGRRVPKGGWNMGIGGSPYGGEANEDAYMPADEILAEADAAQYAALAAAEKKRANPSSIPYQGGEGGDKVSKTLTNDNMKFGDAFKLARKRAEELAKKGVIEDPSVAKFKWRGKEYQTLTKADMKKGATYQKGKVLPSIGEDYADTALFSEEEIARIEEIAADFFQDPK